MKYSDAQVDRANRTNLVDWLHSQGEDVEKSGKEYRWKRHDSVTVYGNQWFQHSQSIGGNAIAFVTRFFNVDYPNAVRMLICEEPDGSSIQQVIPAPSPSAKNTELSLFQLPPKSNTTDIITKYLTEDRGIPEDVVALVIGSQTVYEDAEYHNVVFVGYDTDGKEKYAHCRSCDGKFRADVSGSDKAHSFKWAFASNDTVLVFEAPIDLISYMAMTRDTVFQKNYLSLGGVGSKALDQYLLDYPETKTVILCLDSDQAGEEACNRLEQSIPEGIAIFRCCPEDKDWNDVIRSKGKNYALTPKIEPLRIPEYMQPVDMVKFSQIKQTEVDWLWYPYIPFGKLTMIQGNPGEGKTYLAMYLAAACTNHVQLPNMEPLEPFSVIYQTAEDGLSDTVKPRLIEAGADLERMLSIDESKEALSLSDNRIERAIRQNGAKLMILDPVQAFMGAEVDMNRANEVRPIFRNLADIAQRTGCAIVLIGHLNKTVGTQNAYRGLGSIDITASVRSVIFVSRDKDDPTVRVLRHEKSSLAPPGIALAFNLGGTNGFRWIGEYEGEDNLGNGRIEERKVDQATEMIRSIMPYGKRISNAELEAAGKARGISPRTLRDAKNQLGPELRYEMDGKQRLYYRVQSA